MTISLAELEQCLAVAAYLVVRHGDAYVPTFERLEREVAEAQTRTSDRSRAQRVLADLMKKGVTNASVA